MLFLCYLVMHKFIINILYWQNIRINFSTHIIISNNHDVICGYQETVNITVIKHITLIERFPQ